MMRTLMHVTVIGVALLGAPLVSHAEEIFIARLHGGNEAPPVSTPGTGFAVVVISDRQTEIGFFVAFDDLTTNATLAHIHVAPPGVAGPIIFDLGTPPAETGGFMMGTLTADDSTPAGGLTTFAQALDAIRNGGTYVNVHSVMFGPGEVRGQLRPF